jgi:hypothetical protein
MDDFADMSDIDFYILKNGAVEQSDGSYIDLYGEIIWFNEAGETHREDGPAAFYYPMSRVSWALNGMCYSFDEWCNKLNKSEKDRMMLRLQYV